jgi:hypothetical protein
MRRRFFDSGNVGGETSGRLFLSIWKVCHTLRQLGIILNERIGEIRIQTPQRADNIKRGGLLRRCEPDTVLADRDGVVRGLIDS